MGDYMTKSELIAAIAEKAGLTKAQTEQAFSATFETIVEIMKKEGAVMVPGFGKFSKKERAARQGRNPSSGETITIPKSNVAGFKAAQQLKEAINN